jgi:hypothetical protein
MNMADVTLLLWHATAAGWAGSCGSRGGQGSSGGGSALSTSGIVTVPVIVSNSNFAMCAAVNV